MKTTVVFKDQKGGVKGWIDNGDKVEIRTTISGKEFRVDTVSADHFMSSGAYDQYGSPEERRKMLAAGGGTVETQPSFTTPLNPRKIVTLNQGSYQSGDWADKVVKEAQPDYDHRKRTEYAQHNVRNGTSFTEPLRESITYGLKKEDLCTQPSEIVAGPGDKVHFILEEARKFLDLNPEWTWADLAAFNKTLGNAEAAKYLEMVSKGEDILTHPILYYQEANIYLPTPIATDLLSPYLILNMECSLEMPNFSF